MRAPESEVDKPAPARHCVASRRLACDHGGGADLVYRDGLDELRFDQRPAYFGKRLLGEEDRPFGHRADAAVEAEPREKIQEAGGEELQRVEIGDCARVETELLQHLQQPLDTGRDHEAAALGHPAHCQAEGGDVVEAVLEIARGHRELVEVDKQRRLGGLEP